VNREEGTEKREKSLSLELRDAYGSAAIDSPKALKLLKLSETI